MGRPLFYAVFGLSAFMFAVTECQSTQGMQETDQEPAEEMQSEKPGMVPAPSSISQDPSDEDFPNCPSARRVGILVSYWESVIGSKGTSHHGDSIESFNEYVDDLVQVDRERSPCTGALELVNLNFELAILRAVELTGANNEDYQVVAEAGNEWLAAIEPKSEYSFDTEYSEQSSL